MINIHRFILSIIIIQILDRLNINRHEWISARIIVPGVIIQDEDRMLLESGSTLTITSEGPDFQVTACIGILVDRYWLTTVASCLSEAAKQIYPYLFVRVCGGLERNRYNKCMHEFDRRARYIVIHERYNTKPDKPEFNIAMLKVHKRFSNYMNLPIVQRYRSEGIKRYYTQIKFDSCLVFSYGYIDRTFGSNELKLRKKKVVAIRNCDSAFNFCANETTTEWYLCSEDLGASLVCANRVLGVLAACTEHCPEFKDRKEDHLTFTNLASLQEWRQDIIKADWQPNQPQSKAGTNVISRCSVCLVIMVLVSKRI